jgi:hypothetical protein
MPGPAPVTIATRPAPNPLSPFFIAEGRAQERVPRLLIRPRDRDDHVDPEAREEVRGEGVP